MDRKQDLRQQYSMDSFYGDHVHSRLWDNPEESLDKYRSRIHNELKLLRIDPDSFKGRVMLDMGTGFQSLVFAELGCKQIFHIDISDKQVHWLRQYCRRHHIDSISSRCLDVARPDAEFPPFNIAFIYGVLHHLADPAGFLLRLRKYALPGSRLLFRCYRSGTWSRWLTARLRSLSRHTDILSLRTALQLIFPLEADDQFLTDLVDDLFVPTWNCFDEEKTNKACLELGFNYLCNDPKFKINFSHPDENFRFVLSPDDSSSSESLLSGGNLLQGEDQLLLHPAVEAYGDFSKAWSRMDSALGSSNPLTAALALISLYRFSRKMRLADYFHIMPLQSVCESSVPDASSRLCAVTGVLRSITRNITSIFL